MTEEKIYAFQAKAKELELDYLAKSTIHDQECQKHKLFHITKEALKYHKQIIHEE